MKQSEDMNEHVFNFTKQFHMCGIEYPCFKNGKETYVLEPESKEEMANMDETWQEWKENKWIDARDRAGKWNEARTVKMKAPGVEITEDEITKLVKYNENPNEMQLYIECIHGCTIHTLI